VARDLRAATRLTALRHFELGDADLDPGVLLSWPSLQHLHLSNILLTDFCAPPAAALLAAGGGHNVNAEAPPAVAGQDGIELQQFLQALQQLTQLQHLHLDEISLEACLQAALNHQHQFAALVASPQLTSLELAVPSDVPLPLEGLRQLFGRGVRLPSLRVLRLRGRTEEQREPQLGTADLNGSSLSWAARAGVGRCDRTQGSV
jgi:hypothetical protein